MRRRTLLIGAAAALAACAGPAPKPAFVSDRVSVLVRGQGPDIVLIPGLAAHRDVWTGLADALDKSCRLHMVQVAGFAGFPAGANAAGPVLAPVAEEIVRYISEAGLDQPAVIGHSLGGSIAMMIAARHPSALSRLMVVDMMPFPGQFFAAPDAVETEADKLRAQVQAAAPGTASPFLENMFSGMTDDEASRARLLAWVRASDQQVVGNAFRELIVTDLRPELSHISVPLTLLYTVSAEHSEEQVAAILDSFSPVATKRLIEIPNSKHFIMFDQPQRFLAEVEAFMQT